MALFNERPNFRARAAAVHALQKLVVNVLKRQIHVFHNLVVVANLAQQLVRYRVRIAIEHAHPVHAGNLAGFAQKAGEKQRVLREIVAVARRILRDENQLRHAAGSERPAFFQYVVVRPRAIRPANQRNRAIGAAVAAAVRNFYIGGIGGRGQHALHLQKALAVARAHRPCAAVGFLQELKNAAVIAHAHEAVHLGDFLLQSVRIALGKTAGHEQLFEPARLFVFGHFKNGVDGFFLRRFDEAAGVHEDDFRLGGVGNNLVPVLREHAQQNLAVHAVLAAAQRNHADFGSHGITPLLNGLLHIDVVFAVLAEQLAVLLARDQHLA